MAPHEILYNDWNFESLIQWGFILQDSKHKKHFVVNYKEYNQVCKLFQKLSRYPSLSFIGLEKRMESLPTSLREYLHSERLKVLCFILDNFGSHGSIKGDGIFVTLSSDRSSDMKRIGYVSGEYYDASTLPQEKKEWIFSQYYDGCIEDALKYTNVEVLKDLIIN